MDNRVFFQKMEAEARKRWFPKLKVTPKSDSTLMKMINWLFNLFKPKDQKDWFMKNFWTTIGYTIYWPIAYVTSQIVHWWTLLHELGHCFQKRKWKFLFNYLYLFPISQGILLILTCWLPVFWASGWWLLLWIVGWVVVAGIHFIPQLPDPWRAHWEYQCFCISMFTYNEMNKGVPDEYIERLVTLFSDMSYYQMEPRKDKMRKKLNAARVAILQRKTPAKTAWIYDPLTKFYAELRSTAS